MGNITMELYYGGKIVQIPMIRYVGGKVEKNSNYDPDLLSVPHIAKHVHSQGFKNAVDFWFKYGEEDMSEIRVFDSDEAIRAIFKRLKTNPREIVQIYVEHTIDDPKEMEEPSMLMDIPVEIETGQTSSEPKEWAINSVECDFPEGDIESDYTNSDELNSRDSSDDDKGKPKWPEFNEKTDMQGKIDLKVGMKFADFRVYRKALKEYSIETGIDFSYICNDSKRITVVCKNRCGWRVHASPTQNGDAFQIKTFWQKDHNCGWVRSNTKVTASWLSTKYIDNIRDQPDWKNTAFVNQVHRDRNVHVSTSKAYRAKRMAIDCIEGTNLEQFSKVWKYCAAIRKFSPGSTTIVQSEHMVFQRMYISLDACKKGFLAACRPIVCVDGCFLKSRYGGQLLCAVGKDGNENMYPIAFAVVEAETRDSWQWFIQLLLNDIGTFEEKGWVIMSDRQKGLNDVLKAYGCEHRFCVRHLYSNFKIDYKGKSLKDELWNAARSTTIHEFEKHMENIKTLDPSAEKWLRNIEPSSWSKHAFNPRTKCDILQNNIAETFNSFVLEARDKPILTMCEIIRRMIMKRFIAKKEGMRQYTGPICPRIQTKLEKAKRQSEEWIAYSTGDDRFEVENAWMTRKVVDLNQKMCDCRQWDLTGIPCAHAVASIYKMNLVPEDFVHLYYLKDTFERAYDHIIQPIPGEEYWPETNQHALFPPKYKNAPGRPKKARKKTADEPVNPYRVSRKGQSLKCGNCGAWGHNARGCKGPLNSNRMIKKKKQSQGIDGSTSEF